MSAPIDPDVITLIKKMQEQLNALERKIDALISRPQERSYGQDRPFNKGKFSRPFKPHGSSSYRGRDTQSRSYEEQERGEHFSSSKERSSDQAHPFAKFITGASKRGFSPKFNPKKKFFNKTRPSK